MANDHFNGAQIYFPTSGSGDLLGPLRDIQYGSSGAKADMTGAADAQKTYKVGIPDNSVSTTFVGGVPSTIAVQTAGVVTVAWNDGSQDSDDGTLANAEVSDLTTGGSMDGEITSSLTFVPAPA